MHMHVLKYKIVCLRFSLGIVEDKLFEDSRTLYDMQYPTTYKSVHRLPYSGKPWRALNLANQSSECIGKFKFGDRERFHIEQ